MKRLEKMESLQMEFEIAVADNGALQSFLDEVSEKLTHMSAFKRTFTKFGLSMDMYFKKGDPLPVCIIHPSCLSWHWMRVSAPHGKPLACKQCQALPLHVALPQVPIRVCMHFPTAIQKEAIMEEKELATKLGNLRTHEATINFTLENFDKGCNRLNAILEKPKGGHE
jgi:hypothetical protein